MKIRTTHSFRLALLGSVLALAGPVQAGFAPIPITPGSFSGDAVVEKTATTPIGLAVTASIDNGTSIQSGTGTPYAWTWNEQGFFTAAGYPTTGLPAAGSTFAAISNSLVQFQMAPSYAANNAIIIDGTVTNGTWKLTTPAAYTHLSFLSSGGNGGLNINVTARHENGTTSTGSFSSPDWFGGTSGVAWIARGRANANNHGSDSLGTANPRLYYRNIALANTTSPVTNITLSLGSGGGSGHVGIMAVSGSVNGTSFSPIAVTGYTVDVVVDASAPQPGAMRTATTLTMDGGTNNTGNTWYEQGYQPLFPTSGLPPAGSTFTSASLPDHTYQMPPSYTGNNAIYVDSNSPVGNITFATPAAYSALSFLSATANGNVTNGCTIQYQDGTSETKQFVSKDWFNNTPLAYNANGRFNTDSKTFDAVNTTPQNPRLYEAQFAIGNTVSPVTNVVLTWLGAANAAARVFVFAVSGSTGPVPPIIGDSPSSLTTYEGTNFTLNATISGGNPPFTYKWQKGTNGVFVDLNDGGPWSGTDTLTLSNSGAALADAADYRIRVSNAAGTVNSGIATVTVISSSENVLRPGDTIVPVVNNSPGGENVSFAIDGTTSKYLNFGLNSGSTTPVGFIVTPSQGSTFVTGLRLFTANDAPERDPANSILEGSNDGGNKWTLIWSNSFTLPDTRNNGGLSTDPMLRPMIERNFANPTAYTMYRWRVTQLKNRPAANSMQIGEVQLLGHINTTPQPIFVTQPLSVTVYADGMGSAFFYTWANGSPDPTYQWQKGTNGVFVNINDDARISGTKTPNLAIVSIGYDDEADYRVAATNSAGYAFSAMAHLKVISPLTDVTQPGDSVTVTGDVTANTGTTANLVNNNTTAYVNGGHGPSAEANFPPWWGPVTMVITPSKGSTLVSALRIYTSDTSASSDPADFRLEGSNNGGTSYTLLAAGTLALPEDRNAGGVALDPLTQAMQEIRFANSQPYTSYRLTVTNARNNDSVTTMRIGELELLGLSGPTLNVTPSYLTVAEGGNAQFTVIASGSGTLTYQWKHGANGVYTNLTNSGTISGATTETLSITGATGADDGDYVVVVTDDILPSTSQPVLLNVISAKQDVSAPGDAISMYGGSAPTGEAVEHAIENDTQKYLNFGLPDGDTANPFLGPVGLVVTPSAGPSQVTGLRFYAANDAVERDPADYLLEGSNDGGASYTLIATGAMRLPTDRNAGGLALDPMTQANREVRFANTRSYLTYRLAFTKVRDNAAANSVQFAEVELLGQFAPQLTVSAGAGGSLVLTTSLPGTLWSTLEVKDAGTVWVNEGPISGTTTITPTPGTPNKFYRVTVP